MTQAHKTPGAIVIFKEEWKEPMFGESNEHRFEVISEIAPGHLHVRSIDDPNIEWKGLHDERFQTYHGADLKGLKKLIQK
jgi:hypothetical protein